MDELQCPWCGETFATKKELDEDYRKCNAQVPELTEDEIFGLIYNENNY